MLISVLLTVCLFLVSLNPSKNGKALLLTSGTEVSIAPKTRGKPNGTSASPSQPTEHEKKGITPKETKEAEDVDKPCRVLRVLPSRVMPPYNPSSSSLDAGSLTALAFVSRTLLNAIAGKPLYTKPTSWIANAQKLSCPVDPSQDPNTSGTSTVPAAVPRVLVAQDQTLKASKAVIPDETPSNQILVCWSPDVPVPDNHVVLYGAVTGVEDWDQVK